MAKGIEIQQYRHLRPGSSPHAGVCLARIQAHAYHDQVLGFDQAEIKAAYQVAVEKNRTTPSDAPTARPSAAYAMTNAQEVFRRNQRGPSSATMVISTLSTALS